MSKIAKSYYGMLDLAKFLCALLILFYHFFSEHGSLPHALEEALSAYAIAVALFMGISGFLVFSKLEHIPERGERWKVIRRQVWRTLRIYLLWSVIYILYTVSKWDLEGLSAGFVFLQLRQWIFGSTFYTIWFMPSLALGLLLAFWITEHLPEWAVLTTAALFYVIGALTQTYSPIGYQIPGVSVVAEFSSNWLGGDRGWVLYGFPFICLGRYVAIHSSCTAENRWLRWMIQSFISVLLMLVEALTLRHFFGHTGIDMAMMMPVSVFCILRFLLQIQMPERKRLLWMRQMSVLIFVTQRIFLTVIPGLFPALAQILFANNYLAFLFCVGGTTLFSAGIIALSRKVTFLRLLY